MQKKYSFKLNLLLSTFLISSACSVDDAYSNNYRSGVELPSIEVNFSVIEELKKKEIIRKREDSARLRAIQEAQYAANQRALQQQTYQQDQSYQQQQGEQFSNNNANSSNNAYYYNENTQTVPNSAEQQSQREGIYKQPQTGQQYNDIEQAPSQYKNQPQYQHYVQQQVPEEQEVKQLINNDANGQKNQKEYKAHSALPPKTQSPHSEILNDIDESNYEAPYKMVIPILKPSSNNPNEVQNVGNIAKLLRSDDVETHGRYENQIKPGLRDNFIKVTNPSMIKDKEGEKVEPKVSYFKFPKRNKIQESRVDNDWEGFNGEIIDNGELDVMEMPEDIYDSSADISSHDKSVKAMLPKVKEVKIYNSKSELKKDLQKDKVDTSELKSEANVEVPVKKESFVNVINKLSNVKKFFSFNDINEKSENIVENKIDQQSEVEIEVADAASKALSESELIAEESKALIPVEVNELEEISQNNAVEDDTTKPLKLDGISSIGSISDWRIADNITASLNNQIINKPGNMASIGSDVSIILPKEVEGGSDDQISTTNTPLPRTKPIQKEFTKKNTVQQVIENIDAKKDEEVSSNTDNKTKAKTKTVQSEKKVQEPIVVINKVNNKDKVVKVDLSKNTEDKVEKLEGISKTTLVDEPKRNIKPLSDAQWAEELEKAKGNALAVEVVEKKETKVDISKFKRFLKQEDPKQVANEKIEEIDKVVSKVVGEDKVAKTENVINSIEQAKKEDPVKDVVYLEDIAKSLKKNRLPKNNIELSSINTHSSQVSELVGLKMSVPSSEIGPLDETRFSISNKPSFSGLLKIQFNEDQLELTKSDNERISKLVNNIKSTNKKVEIVSYASSAKLENARRISLKRAIAVRAAMLEAGLSGNKVHVQAAGLAQKEQDENSVNISFVN